MGHYPLGVAPDVERDGAVGIETGDPVMSLIPVTEGYFRGAVGVDPANPTTEVAEVSRRHTMPP